MSIDGAYFKCPSCGKEIYFEISSYNEAHKCPDCSQFWVLEKGELREATKDEI
jgi:Zn-finger nucleic acid-binding protein